MNNIFIKMKLSIFKPNKKNMFNKKVKNGLSGRIFF